MLGALGLIFFGSSIVSIYKIVLLNFTAPPSSGSIHDVLSGLRIATVSGIALTLGLACACYGISKENSIQKQSRRRRYLHRLSAYWLIAGTLPALNAIRHVSRDFARFATSGANPDHMLKVIETSISTVTTGCIGLALGTALLLVATLVGPKVTLGQDSELRTLRTGFAAKGSVLLGIIITLVLAVIHYHANQLESLARTPRADSETYASLFISIGNNSVLVFIGLTCQGLLQIWVRRIKPALEPDVSEPELTDATPPVDKITYEQDSLRWERRHRIIGDLPLLLFIPFLALYYFSDDPTAWLSGFLTPLVCGIYFSVAGIHRLFEPLPPQGDTSRVGKKLRRNLWTLLFVLAALLTLTAGLAELAVFLSP